MKYRVVSQFDANDYVDIGDQPDLFEAAHAALDQLGWMLVAADDLEDDLVELDEEDDV